MADEYKGIPIIDIGPAKSNDILFPKNQARGMEPRNYDLYPQEMFASPDEMSVIPKSEWDARYDEQEKYQSSLEHIYLSGEGDTPRFVNLDQNGNGYCWAYSVGHALMIKRLAQNQTVNRLNPHATAAIIKGGRDEGGWCGLSAKFAREVGYTEEGTGPGQWPLHSRNLKYDTPECRALMAKYKSEEDWFDLTKQVYDQEMNSLQLATCAFNNIPAPSDFNFWSHSVCQIRWVRIEKNSWGPLILNSWAGWGRYGLAVLRGSQAVADGAVAVRSTTAS